MVKLTISRPSGAKLHEFCAIHGNTTAVYPFSQNKNTASEEGINECEVTLYGRDGTQITAPRFTLVVSDRVVNMDDNTGVEDDTLGIIDDIVHEEQARRVAEDGRVSAEEERVAAEDSRGIAEAGRVAAEEARVVAEENRVSAYKKIEHDTVGAILKILNEQESIISIQNDLIKNGTTQERLAEIIALQRSYIGGNST